MDVVAHTLWTNVVFYAKYAQDRRRRYLAAFFGVLPDIVAFAPAFVVMLWQRVFDSVTVSNYLAAYINPSGLHAFAVEAYNYTHSLVISLGVFILVSVILSARAKKPVAYWSVLGWSLHIVIDIFTHQLEFFPTPFLFPFFDYHNPYGISWAHPTFMAINYACLIIAYLIIWRYQKRHRQQEYAGTQ